MHALAGIDDRALRRDEHVCGFRHGFRVRAANVDLLTDDLGSLPVGWELLEGAQSWDIVEAIASWSADRYVDLRAVRRESPRS